MARVITAIVMVSVETDKIPEVAAGRSPTSTASARCTRSPATSTSIAIVRVREFDQIAEVIAGRLSKVAGVVHTDTHIAFRAYSRHDLEAAFSIGSTAD